MFCLRNSIALLLDGGAGSNVGAQSKQSTRVDLAVLWAGLRGGSRDELLAAHTKTQELAESQQRQFAVYRVLLYVALDDGHLFTHAISIHHACRLLQAPGTDTGTRCRASSFPSMR